MNSTTEKFLERMMEKIQAEVEAEKNTQIEKRTLSNLDILVKEGIISTEESAEFQVKMGIKPKRINRETKKARISLTSQSCGSGGLLRGGSC